MVKDQRDVPDVFEYVSGVDVPSYDKGKGTEEKPQGGEPYLADAGVDEPAAGRVYDSQQQS